MLVAAVCALLISSSLRAEEPPARPASVLEQMSRESQALYQDVQRGVVRLQLPPPKWLNEVAAKDNPIDKWAPQLTATVKQKLERDRQSAQQGKYNVVNAKITPTTPTTQPHAGDPEAGAGPQWQVTQEAGSNTVILQSTGAGAAIRIQTGGEVKDGRVIVGGQPQLSTQPAENFAPNNIGLIFDDAGHLLVPLYLEKETVGDGVRASVGDGPVVNATFVASDQQTNLTVLLLPPNSGKPVKLSAARPPDGALVMLLAPNSASARLMLWAGGERGVAGVVVDVDGSVFGFARYGQFLSAGACKPVVEELVKNGRVKRAVLGVMVREVPRDDPLRGQMAALGAQPALRVEQVNPDSAAAHADIKIGDLILSVAGESVGDPAAFAAAISNRSGKTSMRILREGKATDLTVEMKPQ
jgi:hypothetical protein